MEGNHGHQYEMASYWEHAVSQYAGISLMDVEDLDYLDYLTLRRDAFIFNMSQTQKGLEYLDNAWRIGQTKPDRKALRERFGKEGHKDG